MKKIILLSMLTISIVRTNAKTPLIDGVIYPNEYDSKIATGDGKSCPFNLANCKEMYFAQDADFYYLAVSFKATTSMNWAFIISLNDRDGGAFDPRPRMVTYEHPRKPTLMISGSFNSAVPHSYLAYIHERTYWGAPVTFSGSLMASNVMIADQDDCLEISIPKSYLGAVTRFDAQFYLSGATLTRNTVFDAIPDDNIPKSTTATTILHNYAHAFTTLPIALTDFSYANNLLIWATSNELNFSHFEIEKDGAMIGKTSSHNFKIRETGAYRLKMVDLDGSFTYSKYLFVNTGETVESIKILQNPIKNKLKISIEDSQKIFIISIISISGKNVFSYQIKHPSGLSYYNIDLPFLSAGAYKLLINNKQYTIIVI